MPTLVSTTNPGAATWGDYVLIDGDITTARPVGAVVWDSASGFIYRSTDAVTPTYTQLTNTATPSAWTAITGLNDWSSVGSPYADAGWRTHTDGTIELRGQMVYAGLGTAHMATLPAAARPGFDVILGTARLRTGTEAFFSIDIDAGTGQVTAGAGLVLSSGLQVSLDGLRFPGA